MVSVETLMSYPDCKLPFTVHTDDSDKKLSAVISQKNKIIDFLSSKLSKPHINYTKTEENFSR